MDLATVPATICCAECSAPLIKLECVRFVKYTDRGGLPNNHLVAPKDELVRNGVKLSTHHETQTLPFKRGKLDCGQCGHDVGNLQNNLPRNLIQALLQGRRTDVGLFKFAAIRFKVSDSTSQHQTFLRISKGSALASMWSEDEVTTCLTPAMIVEAASVNVRNRATSAVNSPQELDATSVLTAADAELRSVLTTMPGKRMHIGQLFSKLHHSVDGNLKLALVAAGGAKAWLQTIGDVIINVPDSATPSDAYAQLVD